VASIAPALSREWLESERVQIGLDQDVGPSELARLHAQGVDWFVVLTHAPTTAPCDYANEEVKVCLVSP
jgi:2',3'-cyclic-nucleotide 2'-phosphodiesterase (5'-nucleotidase family)